MDDTKASVMNRVMAMRGSRYTLIDDRFADFLTDAEKERFQQVDTINYGFGIDRSKDEPNEISLHEYLKIRQRLFANYYLANGSDRIFNDGTIKLNNISRKQADDSRRFLKQTIPKFNKYSLTHQYIEVFAPFIEAELGFLASVAPEQADKLFDLMEQKAQDFTAARNNRTKAPAAANAITKRTGEPEKEVYVMQGKGLDDFIRQTEAADIPLLAYMVSNKSTLDEQSNLWVAPLIDFLTLTQRKDTPDTRRNIRESIKRLRKTEYSFNASDGSGSGIDFAFGSESGVTRDGHIILKVSDRARFIVENCRLPLDTPTFLYRLPSKDQYTFKVWYKMASDIYINMGKSEVASKAQKSRIENRQRRLSIQSICNYIGLSTDIKEIKYYRRLLFEPFNTTLAILANNNAVSYYFTRPGDEAKLSLEEYNNLSLEEWRSLIIHFDMPINTQAIEAKVTALKSNAKAERNKHAKQAKRKASKPKPKPEATEQQPEQPKTYISTTPGLFDE